MNRLSTNQEMPIIEPTYDVLNCGSRHRYWANGKLVHNSDKINLQNLPKRKGDTSLRRSMTAPAGHVLIATDSSQIEARLLSSIANERRMVDIFVNKLDPYSDMAAKIYGMTYEQVYNEAKVNKTKQGTMRRNVGKTTILGCIAEGTPVLTARGWIPIEKLHPLDLLWDGEHFVSYEALLYSGEKECIEFNGVSLTPDHKVFDGQSWEEAQYANTLRTRLFATRNLPDNLPGE